MRIKNRNADDFLMIPAWDFYGYTVTKFTEEAARANHYRDMNDEREMPFEILSQSFLTINAIDGTVINRVLGY